MENGGIKMIFETEDLDIEIESGKIEEVLLLIKKENPGFCQIILEEIEEEKAREKIYHYFYRLENHCLQSYHMNPLQRYQSQQALRVLKNLFSARHEVITHFSVYQFLKKCFNKEASDTSLGFAYEILFLFRALKGTKTLEHRLNEKPVSHRAEWTRLDTISKEVKTWIKRYPSGLDDNVIQLRRKNETYLKEKFQITNKEWNDWDWQRKHVIHQLTDLEALISLNEDEKKAIQLANQHNIPFGITPYYLSLLDVGENSSTYDHFIRSQALPLLKCIERIIEMKKNEQNKPLTRDSQIPPEISITRGYPMSAVFKPMQTNIRFCMYGERNWEMNYALWKQEAVQMEKIDRAIRWFDRHTEVNEVLITGDILIFNEEIIEDILSRFADIPHIQRIRVSTRIPAILPFRMTDSLVHLLSSYQISGRRDISLMTHFEHAYEVTLDAMKGIQKLRKAGIQVYNQSTYTIDNSRRFEMAALRKQLRLIGVDPYYSFNAKKDIQEERVPIARMIQEQSEESRLAPGIDRADEAVFSIPGVGKNYLKASQEHELIMILGDGSRVYEFYPSDVYLINKKPFLYRDVPIYTFLQQVKKKGESLKHYQSIWYYY